MAKRKQKQLIKDAGAKREKLFFYLDILLDKYKTKKEVEDQASKLEILKKIQENITKILNKK